MQLWKVTVYLLTLTLFGYNCTNSSDDKSSKPVRQKKIQNRIKPDTKISYTLDSSGNWLKDSGINLTEEQLTILYAVNRTDKANIKSIKPLVVPNTFSGDISYYLPFPIEVKNLDSIRKILLFSYPSQTFAAYEYGELVYTGPTNMGRKNDATPVGLYFTNWKAEQTTSTFNDEWDLRWNFNIENKEGIGFHQYALPGYPASHSCLRLSEKDAKYLYNWAEQWILKGTDNIVAKGTPVIVFGIYPFEGNKPWLRLSENANLLSLTESQIKEIVAPYYDEILKEQTNSESQKVSLKK